MEVLSLSKKVISIAPDEEWIEEVALFCGDVERKRSWVISQAVRNYLDDREDAEVALNRLADLADPVILAEEMDGILGI